MKITNIILNIITKILTILLAITYSIGIIDALNEKPLFMILGWILCIFIFMTSLVDIIRIKNVNIKTNIINLILILIILLNIYRPFIDSLIFDNLINDFGVNADFSLRLFSQNFLSITIFMIILFIINFKFKTK